MNADGLMLESVFKLCGAGALLGIVISDQRDPVLLAWFGSLAALLTMWVGATFCDHVGESSSDLFKG